MYQNPNGVDAPLSELLRYAPDKVSLDTFETIVDQLEEFEALKLAIADTGFDSLADLIAAQSEAVERLERLRDKVEEMSKDMFRLIED